MEGLFSWMEAPALALATTVELELDVELEELDEFEETSPTLTMSAQANLVVFGK